VTELEDLRVRCRIVEKKLAEATAGLLEFADKLSSLRTENKRMREDHLFVAKTAQDMLDVGNNKIDRLQETANTLRNELHTQKLENEHLREENQRFQDAVDEALDALEEQYDADCDEDGHQRPNGYMKIGQALEEALGRGGRYGL
jgi:lysophospholipase L1-like esterase